MNTPPVDQYIDKLNATPPMVVESLRKVRDLDKEALALQNEITGKRELALSKITAYEGKKNPRLKAEIEELLKDISQIHKKMMNISKEKMNLAQKVYNCIDEPTEDLDEYLSNHPAPSDHYTGPGRKHSKSKRHRKQNDWEEDVGEPHYCYCRRPSFGVMVMCDNPSCETEWFHTDCIEQKSLNEGEKWFCRDCRRTRTKGRQFREERNR